MSSDPKGPETIPLTAEADEHEGHYAWEVEPFDPEGPVGIVISMADVECGQPLDATLVVLADSDDEREVKWARSTADDIAARLNEHQAQAATIAELQREIGGYRQALERAHRDRIAQSNGYSCGCWWDTKDDEAPAGVTLVVSPDCWLARVLAGKEARA
jgi:hypothetical protein